jgi:hypothetical protein
MPIYELIEDIMKSEASLIGDGDGSDRRGCVGAVGLVYLVDEVHLVYLVCPVGLARAIS